MARPRRVILVQVRVTRLGVDGGVEAGALGLVCDPVPEGSIPSASTYCVSAHSMRYGRHGVITCSAEPNATPNWLPLVSVSVRHCPLQSATLRTLCLIQRDGAPSCLTTEDATIGFFAALCKGLSGEIKY